MCINNLLNFYKKTKCYIIYSQILDKSIPQTHVLYIYLLDYLRTNNAKGLYTGMIMLDLLKAFDTVDHNFLCSKLKVMGVQLVDWFESYLTDKSPVCICKQYNFRTYECFMWGAPG